MGNIEITLGGMAFPFLLSAILSYLYSFFKKADGTDTLSDRMKNVFALVIAIGLALASLPYNGIAMTYVNVFNYTLYGFIQAMAAIGLYDTLTVQVHGTRTSLAKAIQVVKAANGKAPQAQPSGGITLRTG